MKKILIPTPTRKEQALQTLVVSVFFLIFFSAHAFGQCCVKFTTTKTCRDKSTGTAIAIPCNPGNYTFKWDDPAAQTGAVATGLAAGTYHVVMSGANFSCPAVAVIIPDSSCTPFSVPNIMTPNGDGINDHFFITGLETGTKLTVFNRWGDIVYSSNNYNNDWDAGNLTEGVYFYVLNLPTTEITKGKNDPSRGFIQIINGKN
jgi:gliding motility-associated-like protein